MKNSMSAAKIMLIAAGIAVVAVPTASFAKGGGGHGGRHGEGPRINFETLDADSDGQVTQAEMDEHRTAEFAARDTDGDGFLSKEEIIAATNARAEERVEKMLERRDANSDGKLSADEIGPREGRMADRFARLDTDESGGVSKEEFEAAMKKFRKGRRHGSE